MIRPDEVDIDESSSLGLKKSVFKATYNNGVVAVKVLSHEASWTALQARTSRWESLDHPNVSKFIGLCIEDADPLFLVNEYHAHMDASKYLQENPNAERPKLILDVVVGMQYLHSRGVIHGGLKTSDILIKDNGQACVSDYGMLDIQPSKNDKAHRYYSPEAWKGETSKPSDVYAFSMCAFEIFTSSPPWGVLPEKHIIQMVCHEDGRPDHPDHKYSIRVGLTDQHWEVIEECWQKEPRMRPTFDIILRLWQAAMNGTIEPPSRSAKAEALKKQKMRVANGADDLEAPPAYSPEGQGSQLQSPPIPSRSIPPRLPSPHSPLDVENAGSIIRPSSRAGSSSRGPSVRQYVPSSPPPSAPATVNSFSTPPLATIQPLNFGRKAAPANKDDWGAQLYGAQDGPSSSSDTYSRQSVPRTSAAPARRLTQKFSRSNLSEASASGLSRRMTRLNLSNQDVRSMSDIGSTLSGTNRVNPVLLSQAFSTEVREGGSVQKIDDHLARIHLLASDSDKSAQKLITAGVIPTLISLLKSRASADAGLEMVLMALGALAYDSLSANTIYRTDTTTTLIELFSTSESDDVAALAVWTLTRLTRTPEIASGLIKRGLATQLVHRGLHGGSRAAALSAWCLGNLIHTDAIADQIADQGLIPDVVDHLRHSTSLDTSTADDISSGLFAIARIARSIKLAKQLAKAGCVELVAQHLNTSLEPTVLHWAARAVGCLMRPNSSDMSKILLEKGTAKGLARLPSVLPTEDVEPLASFAFAIQRFSCAEWGGGTRKALVEAGVVDSLLAALRTAADEPYPQVHIELALAVSFLGDVGGSSIRKEITHAGGVKILKNLAQNGSTEVAKACNMAATSISGNIWTRNAASAKTAMNHNWSGGCPEYHPPCPVVISQGGPEVQ